MYYDKCIVDDYTVNYDERFRVGISKITIKICTYKYVCVCICVFVYIELVNASCSLIFGERA